MKRNGNVSKTQDEKMCMLSCTVKWPIHCDITYAFIVTFRVRYDFIFPSAFSHLNCTSYLSAHNQICNIPKDPALW